MRQRVCKGCTVSDLVAKRAAVLFTMVPRTQRERGRVCGGERQRQREREIHPRQGVIVEYS